MTIFFLSTRKLLQEYSAHLHLFRPNARLYLAYVVITGASMGVYRLLFNFFVLSRGYDEALLGNLVTASSLTGLISAIPNGYLADRLGRKASLLISALLVSLSIAGTVLFPSPAVFLAMNIISGAAQSLAGVTMSPFLMENSGQEERTYLFSFGQGLQMASASVGNWIGGYLPGWISSGQSFSAISSQAYGGSLLVITGTATLGLIPLALLRSQRLAKTDQAVFAPFAYASRHPADLTRLILPMLITSIGAGLIMPFMNVFFRQAYNQPDPVIGSLFAWGSLAMGIGLMVAPPLADRMGKVPLVVVSQALSIPFLILLGFAPWFWLSALAYYIRVALMNMSMPVYQTFIMERVEPESRATVASLANMSWNFGWAFSPTISGLLQVRYGFGPPFLGTILLYILSTAMYAYFFLRKSRKGLFL